MKTRLGEPILNGREVVDQLDRFLLEDEAWRIDRRRLYAVTGGRADDGKLAWMGFVPVGKPGQSVMVIYDPGTNGYAGVAVSDDLFVPWEQTDI